MGSPSPAIRHLFVPARIASRLAAATALALALAGCIGNGGPETTGALRAAPTAQGSAEGWKAYSEEWSRRYEANPGDKTASLNYARALRVLDNNQQAVAVLESAALKAPNDPEILGAYGKALIDVGQLRRAQEVLGKAHTPDRPDWRILSAQGAVADQLGEHDRAQALYATALKLQPDDPGVLSNLGLSYALSRKLPEAEATLRKAADLSGADPRARQNLALVLGLQGRFAEAEEMARRDLPPVEAAQSVAAMRMMVARSATPAPAKPVTKPRTAATPTAEAPIAAELRS